MSDLPFLGVDIAKDTFQATLLIAKVPGKKFRNNASGIKQLNAWLVKQGCDRVWMCLEYTNKYWMQLADFMHANGHQVSVISPAVFASYAKGQRRSKGDEIDSKLLATYCRDWRPRLWCPPTNNEKKLKEIARAREFLKSQLQAVKNHSDTLEFGEVKAVLLAQLQSLQSQIAKLTEQLQNSIEKLPDLQLECDIWQSLKGVGPETTAAIASEFGSLAKFDRYITLRRLAGLDCVFDQSGTSVRGKERSSKKGCKRIRAVLHMAAMSAMKDNPRFRAFAKRLKRKGKLGSVIVNAVANKILLTLWSMSRSKTPFEPDHVPDWLRAA
jgi:transposase